MRLKQERGDQTRRATVKVFATNKSIAPTTRVLSLKAERIHGSRDRDCRAGSTDPCAKKSASLAENTSKLGSTVSRSANTRHNYFSTNVERTIYQVHQPRPKRSSSYKRKDETGVHDCVRTKGAGRVAKPAVF